MAIDPTVMKPTPLKHAIMISLMGIIAFLSAVTHAANLNVLVLGSSRSYSSDHYSSVTRNQNAFNPQLVANELQNILDDDSAYTNVTVRFEDISANTITRSLNNPTTNATSRSYSLLNYYYWPDGRANRLANLKGTGTGPDDKAWDHVIILGDPSNITNLPGVYAMGVKLIVDTINQGNPKPQPLLMMQWPHSGSSVPVSDFGEVTYRVGDSGGIPVVPAGFAWDAYTSKDSGSHPTPDGAYLAAATIYNKMLGKDASSDSAYTYKNGPTTNTLATLANNTVQTHNTASHYSGAFNQVNPHKRLDDKDRVIQSDYGAGSSTEQTFLSWGQYNSGRYFNILLQPELSLQQYADAQSEFSGLKHFHIGRNNPSSDSKRYRAWPATYRTAYAYSFQIRNQDAPSGNGGQEMLYGIDYISGSYRGDQRTAFDLISLDHVSSGVRVLPIHTLWAAAKDELGITTPFSDGNHYAANVNEAAVSYMMTNLTGRCPIGKNGTATERTRQRIGYDMSWIMSSLNLRPPGFTTQPSAYTAKTMTPGTSETMSVYFINAPESSVTVDVSVSANTAAIVSPKTLTFDNTNHDTIQNVRVAGLPGASSSEAFNVVFSSSSTDMCFANLSDSWKYTNNRASTESVSISEQSDRQVTVTANVNQTIDLQVTGSTESNTVLTQPFHGSLSWSGADVIYTPDTDFIGNDCFAFAVNNGGTLTKGYIEITVEDAPTVVITESGGSTDVTETGTTDSYTAVLSQAPAEDVTVTIATDSETTVSPTSLTFTPSDWNSPQTVTVTAFDDSDHELNHTGTISHTTSSDDLDWNAISVNNVVANITDDDNTAPTVDAGSNQTVNLGSSGAWSPAEISPVAWFDASDASTITASSGSVSEWRDKSGNSNNATQNNTNNQPETGVQTLNGLPLMTNRSGNKYMSVANTPTMLMGYAVVNVRSTDASTVLNIGSTASTHEFFIKNNQVSFDGSSSTTGKYNLDGNTYSGLATNHSTTTSGAHIWGGVFNSSSTLNTIINRVGLNADATGHDVGEILWFSSELSTDDQQKLEGYLAHKWGLEDNLPSNHLYKSAAPGAAGVVVNLDGTVGDEDGDSLTTNWSLTSGPTSISIDDSSAVDTSVTLTEAGTYVFQLAADDGYGEVSDEVTIIVNSTSAELTVSISPTSISENGGSATATVTRNSDTTEALAVTLTSSDTSEATVASGNIPAGQVSGTFTITAVDDALYDGTQTVTITASATGHVSGNDTIEITDDDVLPTYTISYNGNGNTSGTAPSNQTKTEGSDITLSGSGDLQRTGYSFTEWNTAANGSGTSYSSGATYTADADLTLYAIWTAVTNTVLVGGSIRNGNFNANSVDDSNFTDTSDWYNLAGDQTAQCTRTNLDYDGSSNYVIASTKQAAVDTGHTISEGDVFDLSYVWRDAYNWVDGSDQVRVSLFVTDDNTLTGSRTDLIQDLSGTSTQNDAYESVDHNAFYTAQAADEGKTLFVVIETTSSGYARLDDFELIVTHAVSNTLTSWISGYSVGGLTALNDDFDKDGIPNGLENYFGTNPGTFSQGIEVDVVDRDNNTITFTHPINDNPASDLTAAYLWTPDLTNYYASGATSNGTTVTFVQGTPSGGMVTVTATITGPSDKIFVAVQVTQP